MIKQILFDDKVEVGISEIDDENMRFFGDGDESDIIKNQKELSHSIELGDVVRIRTIYGERKNFTEWKNVRKAIPLYQGHQASSG